MARRNENHCLNQVLNAFASSASSPSLFCNANRDLILGVLRSARENDKPNEFPDFVCGDGFIEHFEVSPSTEGRKGSAFKREESMAKFETKERFNKWDASFLASESKPHTIQMASIENRYDGFSHPAFIASLRKNVSAHLESLKKQGLTGVTNAAFMAENSGARLCVYEGNIFSRFYAIRFDRKALEVFVFALRSFAISSSLPRIASKSLIYQNWMSSFWPLPSISTSGAAGSGISIWRCISTGSTSPERVWPN